MHAYGSFVYIGSLPLDELASRGLTGPIAMDGHPPVGTIYTSGCGAEDDPNGAGPSEPSTMASSHLARRPSLRKSACFVAGDVAHHHHLLVCCCRTGDAK